MLGVVFEHFSTHFIAVNVERPVVEDFNFKRLPNQDRVGLTLPFSEENVKAAV